jgi:hypothetical protein
VSRSTVVIEELKESDFTIERQFVVFAGKCPYMALMHWLARFKELIAFF